MAHGPSRLIDDLLDVPFLDVLLICHLGVLDCVRLARSCLRGREVTARVLGCCQVLWTHARTYRNGILGYLCTRLEMYPMTARKLLEFALEADVTWKGEELKDALMAAIPLERIAWLQRLGVPVTGIALSTAASLGRADIVALLLQSGAKGANPIARLAAMSHQYHVLRDLLLLKRTRRDHAWLASHSGYFLGRAARELNARVALVERVCDDTRETEEGLRLVDVKHRRFEFVKQLARDSLEALPGVTESLIKIGAVVEPDSDEED